MKKYELQEIALVNRALLPSGNGPFPNWKLPPETLPPNRHFWMGPT